MEHDSLMPEILHDSLVSEILHELNESWDNDWLFTFNLDSLGKNNSDVDIYRCTNKIIVFTHK